MSVKAIDKSNTSTHNSDSGDSWNSAVKEAKDLGIQWERPTSDQRSAEDIIEDSALLKNLGNQSNVKDMLKERVGNYETDADAAYRADQVLHHVEMFDEDGKRIASKDVNNGRIDGFTSSKEARHGTEAGRLQDFGKDGFGSLKGKMVNTNSAADNKESREKAEKLGIKWEREDGDDRSAKEIIDDTPLLKNLGNQSGVKDMLKEQVGDFEKDADAAYRAAQVLTHVERYDSNGNRVASKYLNNGKIDGFTNSGEAKRNTEAGRLQDFGKNGFDSLKGKAADSDKVADNSEARKQAEKLGLKWEREDGDDRSAKEIIDDTPLLKNLGNQSGVKDMLKEQVGDYEKDADAAYRAAQVLTHVERYDSKGDRIAGKDLNNEKIDGFTNSGEARENTEAARLQDFGKKGFSSLKGEMRYAADAAGNKDARKAAESKGIMWELPKDDKRSAKDIIKESPLLKELGNQSDLSEMLKEQIGDFETDADAAFRASQVLERVVMYDADGKSMTGGTSANERIDGVTSSGEAKNNTEAGRLQNVGKYGFEALPDAKKPEDMKLYKDFLKANPDADEASKKLAKYGATLREYFDIMKSKNEANKLLSKDQIQSYRDSSPQLSDEVKEALDFWLQPGAFNDIETTADRLTKDHDGLVSFKDLEVWLDKYAPTTPQESGDYVGDVAVGNITASVNTSGLDADIFSHPENYTVEQKAGAIQDLTYLQALVAQGKGAGLWKGADADTLSIKLDSSKDPQDIIDEITDKIDKLNDDDVTKYLEENTDKQLGTLFENNPGLKDALEQTYNDVINTGNVIDDLWKKNTEKGKTNIPAVLTSFNQTAQSMQNVLGIKGEEATKAIQEAVGKSGHIDEFKDYFKNQLVTGQRYKDLLAEDGATFEKATSTFSMEVAAFSATMPAEYTESFDKELQENFNDIAQENVFKDAEFDDLKAAFGKDGTDQLDEEKLKGIIEKISEENPDFFLNGDGELTTPAQIVAGLRGIWDTVRQGGKSLDKLKLFQDSDALKSLMGTTDKGVMHGVSGLLMAGVTIGKGISGSGKLSEKDIVDIATGSVSAATTMIEGGFKGYTNFLKNAIKVNPKYSNLVNAVFQNSQNRLTEIADSFENATKGFASVGGSLAGIAASAYGIFDGVQSLRKGDKVSGGLNITSGALGIMSGLASGIEGAVSIFTTAVPASLGATAGVLGAVGAVFGAVSFVVMALINAIKHDQKVSKYGDLLNNYMSQYGITGLPENDKANAAK